MVCLFSNSGRLEVRWACNGSIAGYVANNANGGSYVLWNLVVVRP
jgi:hypothetical protein